MEVQSNQKRFDQAVQGLPPHIRDILQALPFSAKDSAFEVRLRANKPIVLTCANRIWFVDHRSQLHNIPGPCFTVNAGDMIDSVAGLCSYSVQSHQEEMRDGFISLKGGHRAGICGTAVISGKKITAVRDITSINLRIARDIRGAADALISHVFQTSLCSTLIVGPPSSGKTTILRDLARQLANGGVGRYYKVAVVDERCEIGAVHEGIPQNDLGIGCDILSGYPKGAGILAAVRTMSPHVILCDEIGSREETDSMLDGLNCGVKMIVSAHGENLSGLRKRPQIAKLLEYDVFDKIVLLGDSEQPGTIRQIADAREVRYEAGRNPDAFDVLRHDRASFSVEFAEARTVD